MSNVVMRILALPGAEFCLPPGQRISTAFTGFHQSILSYFAGIAKGGKSYEVGNFERRSSMQESDRIPLPDIGAVMPRGYFDKSGGSCVGL